MPVIGTFWFGIGIVSIFVAIQNYLVDGFRFAASALAAATVFRSLFGYGRSHPQLTPLGLHFLFLQVRCILPLDMAGATRFLRF
jgi:hypothetical protein